MIAGIRRFATDEVTTLSMRDAVILTLGLANSPLTIQDTKRYLDFFIKKNHQIASFCPVSITRFENLVHKLIRNDIIDQSIGSMSIYTIFLTENGQKLFMDICIKYKFTEIGQFIDGMQRYFGFVA